MNQELYGQQAEHFAEEHKLETWDLIHFKGECPDCHQVGSMFMGPQGGLCFDMECHECGMVFRSGIFRCIGAYPMGTHEN